ncbi:hypothetical protein HOLleu_30354 [Holothuria leucospilota]|uniref:Uncharacterized protein n=1 Tax=Holothuria leucospilota TaxID=206669 RepID=A0A9Q1H125_HOLLE|nr:hypothetical protein HOLleu_30354 [Holothuria leucospilota]
MLRERTQLFLVEVKGHLRSLEVKKQNFLRIPKIVVWRHQRSKSKISQEFPRLSYGVTTSQKAKFSNNFQDCHGVTRHNKSKIPQEFPRSSSGVTKGQKAKFPKNSQDCHLGSPEVKKQISQEFSRSKIHWRSEVI